MDGSCLNAFLLSKVKISYEELKKQLEKYHAKKKNAQGHRDKIAATLEKLTFFNLDLGLLPILLDCSSPFSF